MITSPTASFPSCFVLHAAGGLTSFEHLSPPVRLVHTATHAVSQTFMGSQSSHSFFMFSSGFWVPFNKKNFTNCLVTSCSTQTRAGLLIEGCLDHGTMAVPGPTWSGWFYTNSSMPWIAIYSISKRNFILTRSHQYSVGLSRKKKILIFVDL